MIRPAALPFLVLVACRPASPAPAADTDGTGDPTEDETGDSTPDLAPACADGSLEPKRLLGVIESPEAVAMTTEEELLGLRPLPWADPTRPFWLYVPAGYDADCPGPMIVVLHPQDGFPFLEPGYEWTGAELEAAAGQQLDAWTPVADAHGALLLLPLSDYDRLIADLDWIFGPRKELLAALLDEAATAFSFDPESVFLAGTNAGAHVALSTAVADPDRYAGVAMINPPLFEGPSRQVVDGVDRIYPSTIDELSAQLVDATPPLLVFAGTAESGYFESAQSAMGLPGVERYVDWEHSHIPFDHQAAMVDLLEEAGFDVELNMRPGNHFATAFNPNEAMQAGDWFVASDP